MSFQRITIGFILERQRQWICLSTQIMSQAKRIGPTDQIAL